MSKVGIKECAKVYAEKKGCTLAEADKSMRTAVETITDLCLSEGGVSFMGAFALEVVTRAERKGINPATGESVVYPARRTLKLTIGKTLKDKLNT